MTDVAQQLLGNVFKTLQIDEAWSIREGRSFSWIAHRLEQKVTAHRPVEDDGFTLYKIVAETLVVEGVQATESEVNAELSELNRLAFGSAYSFDPKNKTIRATTSTWVHDETAGWRGRLFEMFCMGQLCFAETEADFLADRCKGIVARREHPTSGERQLPDDMLHLIEDFFVPGGYAANQFENPFEFEALADTAKITPFLATLGADANGIALERCFGDWTAISILTSSIKHRRVGSGLTTLIQLQNQITEEDGYSICAVLNRKEKEEGSFTPHFGAWCVDKSPNGNPKITYKGFYPSLAYQNGLILDMGMMCSRRMVWADQALNAQPTRGNAWERLAQRLGVGRRG